MKKNLFRLGIASFLDLIWGPQPHDEALGSESQEERCTKPKTLVQIQASLG